MKKPKTFPNPYTAEQFQKIIRIRAAGYRQDYSCPNLDASDPVNVFSPTVEIDTLREAFYFAEAASGAPPVVTAERFLRRNPETNKLELSISDEEVAALPFDALLDYSCPNLRGEDGKVESYPINRISQEFHRPLGTRWQEKPVVAPPTKPEMPAWFAGQPVGEKMLADYRSSLREYRCRLIAELAELDAEEAEGAAPFRKEADELLAELRRVMGEYENARRSRNVDRTKHRALFRDVHLAQGLYADCQSDSVIRSVNFENRRGRLKGLLRESAPAEIMEAHAKMGRELQEALVASPNDPKHRRPDSIARAMREVFDLAECVEDGGDALEEIDRIRQTTMRFVPKVALAPPEMSIAAESERTGVDHQDVSLRRRLDHMLTDLEPKALTV